MKARRFPAAIVVAVVLVWHIAPDGPRADEVPSDPALGHVAELRAAVDQYCVVCHNSYVATPATASGVVLDRADLNDVASDPALWERVVRKLRTGEMPPAGMLRPDQATYDALTGWLESHLDRAAMERPSPGRPAIHRLNRAEYANAIRDLLALEVDSATLLPPDDSADGFDNIADVLSLSPALLDRYLAAAAKISALAVGSPMISASSETYRVRGDTSQTEHLDGLPLGTRGGVAARHLFPLDGEYVIKVKLLETNLGTIRGLQHESQLEIAVDGRRVLLKPVGGVEDYVVSSVNATDMVNALDARLQARVFVGAGQRPVSAAFLQPSASLGPIRLQPFLRSTIVATDHLGVPHVEHMTISGPFNATGSGETASRERVFTCRPVIAADDRPCATTILSSLARRAYRRPVTEADLAGLLRFYDEGSRDGFEAGIELALRAMLASPKFVFRSERDPAGSAPGEVYALGDLELASRLSFFLWSSIPDDELLDVAEQGRLRAPDVLARQVERMLADPKSQALVTNFAGQWLHVRNVRSATPDKNDFPSFDDTLRQAFERELDLFLRSIILGGGSVLDLLTADHTFVNERLARHYGMPHVYGSHFRRVSRLDETRRGLLGKGGILLVTSHADRTSPVVRGKFILDNLLGSPPPPPPPDVPALPETEAAKPATMRERMAQHRENPVCASCHNVMDPLGLALENFDAVGAWRMHDQGKLVDASGQLGDGTQVDGAAGLREALLKRPEVLVQTAAEKLLTYALGRGLEPHDMPAVRAIVREAQHDGYKFVSLIAGVVRSTPFRMRSAEETP
jgi:mono/diheme cytochrome c family protein